MAKIRSFFFLFFLFAVLLFWAGCSINSLLVEQRANDPIMMNLIDGEADLSQIEDGTGLIGEATACPT